MSPCHVYFRHCHAHAYYVILSKKFPHLKISLKSRSSRLICHHKAWIVNMQHKRTKSNLPLAILAYTTWYGHCHLVCGAALKHGIWGNIALFFYTIQTPIRYVGCLMIANTWTYNSLYFRNTAIFENKKSVCIFPHPLVNTCDLHLPTL